VNLQYSRLNFTIGQISENFISSEKMKDKVTVTKKEVSWQEKLAQIKNEFPTPKPTKRLRQEWKIFSKDLEPTLIQATARLNIKSEQLFAYIREHKIVPSNREQKQRLKKIDFVRLMQRFDQQTYQHYRHYFEEMELNEKKRLQKEFLEAELRRKLPVTKKKTRKEPKNTPPFRLPYVAPLPVTQLLTISWDEVIFNDYNIMIRFGKSFSKPWPAPDSRKSFKYLKKYIQSLKLEPLQVVLVGNEIKEISNAELVRDVVTILRVRHEFIMHDEESMTVKASKVLEMIADTPTDLLGFIARSAADEAVWIDHLSSLQDKRFKPIPAFEIIASGNSVSTEDTFIFTVSHGGRLYLVWESTLHGRATYIFSTDIERYEESIQLIYDYIASYQKAKRMRIRNREISSKDLNYIAFLRHSSINQWKEKLQQLLNTSP